jgi:hypothetical protein
VAATRFHYRDPHRHAHPAAILRMMNESGNLEDAVREGE